MYIYIYIYIHTYIHTYAYTHIHTYRRGATREAACQTDDLQIDWGKIAARGSGISAGTYVTRFTGTKVQILTRRKAVLYVYICVYTYIYV